MTDHARQDRDPVPPLTRAGMSRFDRPSWVLGLLVSVYASSALDRLILSTLGPAIKRDLRLTDVEFGLLGGIAFVVLYTVMGIPIARLADGFSRKRIITIAVAFWSAMTAVCGLASSFPQLLLARMGVSLGESACSPSCYSLIGDTFPPQRRTGAIAVLGFGVPLGSTLGAFLGGWAAEHLSWREAFYLAGTPGLLLAVVLALGLREPVRGRFDSAAVGDGNTPMPSLRAVLREILKRPAFLHFGAAATLCIFCNFGINLFIPTFLVRSFSMAYGQAGFVFGITTGLAATLGTTGFGLVIGRLGQKDVRWCGWGPALLLVVGTPLYMAAFLQGSVALTIVLLLASCVSYAFMGPALGATQNMVGPRMRATAAAILLFFMNIVGGGLGPLFMGWASDHFAASSFVGTYATACPQGLAPPDATAAVAQACGAASAMGMRHALVACACFLFWAALHCLLAARSVRQDLSLEHRA